MDIEERGHSKAGELLDVAVWPRKVSWSNKVCNEEVLRRVGEARAIIARVINRRQRVAWSYIPYVTGALRGQWHVPTVQACTRTQYSCFTSIMTMVNLFN